MELHNLGITTDEYNVYVEILKSPPRDISVLAKKVTIKRSTLYSVLNSLTNKGLIKPLIRSKFGYKYKAFSPNTLLKIIETNNEKIQNGFNELKNQIPLLNVLYNSEEIPSSDVEYYFYYNESIPILMEDLVGRSREKILGIANDHFFYDVFEFDKAGKVLDSVYYQTVMRVGDRFVFTGDKKKKTEVTKHLKNNPALIGHWEPRWIDSKRLNFDMNINTFEDKTFICIPQNEKWLVWYVKNEKLAFSLQRLCQYLWDTAFDLNP